MARAHSNANVRSIEAVDAIREAIPPALQKLLDAEGLFIESLPERVSNKHSIENRLSRQGILEQAREWRKGFAASCRLCFPGKSWQIAREIAWRLVELKAEAAKDEWLLAVHIETTEETPLDPGVAKLPQDVRWVYLHPALGSVGKLSPAQTAAAKEYETAYPCPNNGARNRLSVARESTKSIADFMKHVDSLMIAMERAKIAKGGSGAVRADVDLEEEEAIADLESRLFQEMKDWR